MRFSFRVFATIFVGLAAPLHGQLLLIDAKSFSQQAVRLDIRASVPRLPEGAEATDIFSKWGLTFRGSDSTVPKITGRLFCSTNLSPPEHLLSLLNSGGPNARRPLIADFRFPVRRVGLRLVANQNNPCDGSGTRNLVRRISVSGFDSSAQLLGTVEAPNSGLTFFGVETPAPAGIAKIVIDYGDSETGEEIDELVIEYLSSPPKFTTYLAQIADGFIGSDGVAGVLSLRTEITVINLASIEARATVAFFDSHGNSSPIDIDGIGSATRDFLLPRGGSRTFVTGGTSNPAKVGYARVDSNAPVEATAVFATVNFRGDAVAEATIDSNSGMVRAVGAVERSVIASLDSGIALLNTSEREAEVTVFLIAENGLICCTATTKLGPKEHQARFLSELFPSVPADFRGTIEILSPEPVASAAVRTRRGLAVSGLPVGSMER